MKKTPIKKYKLNLFTFFTLLYGIIFFTGSKSYTANTGAILQSPLYVRVLLSQDPIQTSVFTIGSSYPLRARVYDKKNRKFNYYTFKLRTVTLSAADNALYINKKKIHGDSIQFLPSLNDRLTFNGQEYEGSFGILIHAKKLLLINQLLLENYVYAVLKSESWPGWPCEVNKAFAIACRSYGAAKIMQARKKRSLYDIRNTNIDQTYKGFHHQTSLKKAVTDTHGLVLTYNKRPIVAMFDSCCGGVIPADIEDVNFNHAPYLARRYACYHCKNFKIYRWEFTLNHNELENLLKKQNIFVHNLYDIKISKRDKAGIVKEIILKSSNDVTTITGKKLYSFLKSIKSYSYAVHQKSKKVIFAGTGYGHHLGMCQWGARAMIDKGYDYISILKFYYPTTKIMKIL